MSAIVDILLDLFLPVKSCNVLNCLIRLLDPKKMGVVVGISRISIFIVQMSYITSIISTFSFEVRILSSINDKIVVVTQDSCSVNTRYRVVSRVAMQITLTKR